MTDQNNSQKYNELGNQIKDSVMNAVNTGDFSGLSDSISQSVYTVLGDVGDSLNKAATQARAGFTLSEGQLNYRSSIAKAQAEALARAREEAMAQAAKYHEEQEAKIQRNKQLRANAVKKPIQIAKFNDIGSVSGTGKVIIGPTLVLMGLYWLALSGISVTGIVSLALVSLLGVLLTVSGVKSLKLLGKAKRFKEISGSRLYCTIDEIASAMAIDKKRAVKEVKKILKKGFFPEGYLDEDCTTLMLSKNVYNQYIETKKQREEELAKNLEDQGVASEGSVKLSPDQQAELHVMMTDGRNAINKLHELNDQIPGQSITEKLYKTEGLLNDIFNRVKEDPTQMKNCHKLMNYHLPTMLKLVEAYAEYDKITVPGEEILSAKEEIEKTLDLINQAFAELLNRLFQDSVWDVTTDAQVLKTMLSQEGLTKDTLVNEEV